MKNFVEEMRELFGGPLGFSIKFENGYEAYSLLFKHFKDWVSPEDHQNIVASKKVLEKSNLRMSEENAKFVVENIELTKEIAELKSQLEKQQPEIPEIPQFVADWLDRTPLYAINDSILVEVIEWAQKQTRYADLGRNINHLLKLKVNGYTVAKDKLFYLKNKITKHYLSVRTGKPQETIKIGEYTEIKRANPLSDVHRTEFTQSEIDNMETGSYEIIEVE